MSETHAYHAPGRLTSSPVRPRRLIALLLVALVATLTALPPAWLAAGTRLPGSNASSPALGGSYTSNSGVTVSTPASPRLDTAGRKTPAVVHGSLLTPPAAPRSADRRANLAPRTTLDRLLAPGRFAYYSMVRRLAARHSVELRLVMAIIASESGGDPEAVSPQGAVGLMQLMPQTAEHLGVDPWDPEQNVEGAIRYLASHLSSFRSVDLSLVAYNAGPGFAARYRAGQVDLGPETRAFLIRVGQLLK